MTEEQCSDGVRLRRAGGAAYVTVGVGERRNALGSEDWTALETVFSSLAREPELRVAVVTGAGSSFSAGSDMREWERADPAQVQDSFERMERAFQAVERLPVPVLAAVNGVAAGAGCQLALACDVLVLTASAKLGMPIARLGILVSPAFAGRLVALGGPALARDLLYTGRLLGAPEALAAGLATRCVPDGTLEREVAGMVEAVLAQPPAAVRAAKAAVATALSPLRGAVEARGGEAVDYDEFRAGVTRFLRSRSRTAGTGVGSG